jgi:hypothetical protein
MHHIFEIDLILTRIFDFLSNEDILNCRLISLFWQSIVDFYFEDVKLFSWHRSDLLLQKIDSVTTNNANNDMINDSSSFFKMYCKFYGLVFSLIFTKDTVYLRIESIWSRFFIIKPTPLQIGSYIKSKIFISKEFTKDENTHYFLICPSLIDVCVVDYTDLMNITFSFQTKRTRSDKLVCFGDYFFDQFIDPLVPNYEYFSIIDESKFCKNAPTSSQKQDVFSIYSIQMSLISIGYHSQKSEQILIEVYKGTSLTLSKKIRNPIFVYDQLVKSLPFMLVCEHYIIVPYLSNIFVYDLDATDKSYTTIYPPSTNFNSLLKLDKTHFVASFLGDKKHPFLLLIYDLINHSFQLVYPSKHFPLSRVHQIDFDTFDLYSIPDSREELPTPFRIKIDVDSSC